MCHLSAKAVVKAVIREKEYKLSDGDGLYLRVRPSGARSFLFCFRLPNDRRIIRMTLGSTSSLSLKVARSKTAELRKLVVEGIDPRNVRSTSKALNSQAITMQTLFEGWIEYVKIAGEVSPVWAKRHEDRWRLHLKKPLEGLLVKDVDRSHLSGALEAMTRRGTREETRKALTTLNLMLDYALTRHSIEHNPARLLKPKDFAATANRPRDRVLSLQELRRLWKALEQAMVVREGISSSATMAAVTATAIMILILTGARRGEVAGMRFDELNLEEGVWLLPAARTKNRQAHTVYLSKLTIQLLQNLKPMAGKSPFVFDTGRYAEHGHIHEDTLTGVIARLRGTATRSKKKKELNGSAPLADIASFSVHDIRRSAATAWGEHLKTAPHVIETMLNHQPLNKLVATYQRAVYAEEQKAAWLAWGRMVEAQIASEPNEEAQCKRINEDLSVFNT